ncbi:carbamoyl phosphate synthase small subunit [Aquibacillus koreensis]|uniref:Carbamoyl phosphate synthase small chain n=1 Tax=Aquibacillus koreensis TaxID=279446 RepID=A0A9X3WP83_9BACI|nr:carbamoyl phosphate synthase small subunit [Aquibacillus koreensis]MCT2534898.1 carbamoyl phosphate synthase small subunit [Aquibacillus koreensis]MDC3422208.1 carbamoyl phosphate synthase small subunit [Aquibacillus koreensis]
MEEKVGYLTLSTGDVLEGVWLGSSVTAEGEMVFNTAMTGYQEVMTDPSYAGQIVTMTYPLIGNYGFNDIDSESIKPSLSGLIISNPCYTPDHYQSNYSIVEMIEKYNIPTLYGVDTRALTRIIREQGEVYGKITENKENFPEKDTVATNVVQRVSVTEIKSFKTKKQAFSAPHVVVMDFGFKHSIMHSLLDLGCDVSVVPFDTTFEQIQALDPDGILLSNGPGNPKSLSHLASNIKQIADHYPTLGICLGHQLVALAYGATTKRLPYGHRGSNHPVKDLITGNVLITSQNHGYVVDMDSVEEKDWQVSHINVNDKSVEGLIHRTKNVMTVQFHPEAHPGPIDTHNIFVNFTKQLVAKGEKQHA